MGDGSGSIHHCDFSNQFLSLLLEVGLLPAAGLGVGERPLV